MTSRGSQHDEDEITWSTAAVRIGNKGLDLRQPSDPDSLTRLLNARFLDERTVEQRDGFNSTLVQDAANFAPLGANYAVDGSWMYGHGVRVSSTNVASWENAHHPIAGRGEHTFRYEGADVMWTGDRLLVLKSEGAALGSSAFWNRSASTVAAPRGVPAYLPLQSDSTPPTSISGDYVETCLTDRHRVFLYNGPSTALNAVIVDRGTGAIVDGPTEISGASNDVVEPKILNSGNVPTAVWRDATSRVLYISWWTGTGWTTASVIDSNVYAFDVVAVTGGFYLLWRVGSPDSDMLLVGKYAVGALTGSPSAITTQDTPFPFATVVPLGGAVPDGPLALGVSPSGQIGVLCSADSALKMRILSPSMAVISGVGWTTVDSNSGWVGGLAITSRGLKEQTGEYQWVVHASRGTASGVLISQATVDAGITLLSTTRYNSILASKSWRVGDEVFCWLRAGNAGTHYMVGGTVIPQVCGYADREEAIERVESEGNYAIPHIAADPMDDEGVLFTWLRPYNTGQDYNRGGNYRIGDLDFIPEVTSVKFGKSQYLSGSAVRNWDGVELGDSGFHDYPVIKETTQGTGGSLDNGHSPENQYYYRVYATRYNRRGERFMSPAVSYGPINLLSSNNSLTLTIKTLPDTNHNDLVFEIYRTETLGTTFYYEGSVPNDLTTGTVAFVSTMADDVLRTKLGDSHAAGVGALSELEEAGPIGCSMLAVSGDRLWGAGGQVAPGVVQFSKLKEEGEGVGFDDLAGFQVVDTEGRTITSIHAQNDTTVVHEADQLYVIGGTGPDNYGRSSFTIPQIVLADGAITHAGTALTQLGAVYWGKGGPRLLTTAYKVINISAPVLSLAETLTPSGVQTDYPRHEVVWYTRDGDALLWNYLGDEARWAQWGGLKVAGCSQDALVTTDGLRLIESADAVGDGGQSIPFAWRSGSLRGEQILLGHAMLKAVGIVGSFKGEHTLRMRVYYNGSPLHTDQWEWDPDSDTWLTIGEDQEDMTAAAIDALRPTDKSGAYVTHKRVSRHSCHFFSVEFTTENTRPAYVPYELSLELGARGGLGRVPVNTFATTVAH